MKVIVQRVKKANCIIKEKIVSEINQGFLLLVGFTITDEEKDLVKVVEKISKLRIFSDENGKMNLSLKEVGGEILSISQFTLYADVKKGNRPSFINSLKADLAQLMYEKFNILLKKSGFKVLKGVFGADMLITLENDGPVTIIIDSKEL